MEGPVETSNGSSKSVPNNRPSALEPVKGFCRPDWQSQSGPNWVPNRGFDRTPGYEPIADRIEGPNRPSN